MGVREGPQWLGLHTEGSSVGGGGGEGLLVHTDPDEAA